MKEREKRLLEYYNINIDNLLCRIENKEKEECLGSEITMLAGILENAIKIKNMILVNSDLESKLTN